MGKPKGETSMLGKRLNAKVCSVRAASPGRMVKPGLAESQFPTVEWHTHRSIPEAMTLEYLSLFDGQEKFSPASIQQ